MAKSATQYLAFVILGLLAVSHTALADEEKTLVDGGEHFRPKSWSC